MAWTSPRQPGGSGDRPAAPPLPAELDALLRRMRLPYLRKAAPDVLATARAQCWETAEVLRVLLAEEVTGRDAATRRMRRKTAGFPSGKTFSSWRSEESSVPEATQNALATCLSDRLSGLLHQTDGPTPAFESLIVEDLPGEQAPSARRWSAATPAKSSPPSAPSQAEPESPAQTMTASDIAALPAHARHPSLWQVTASRTSTLVPGYG
jgi:hypothetical protein